MVLKGISIKKEESMIKIFLFMFLLVILTSCQAPKELPPPTIQHQINEMLSNLQTYRARATVEYISNKGTNTYETIQHARLTGEYRIEVTAPEHVAGNITSSDGQHIYQFNTKINGRITILAGETKERSEIFLTSFINNWQNSQESSVTAANMGEGQYTVLEATIPGNHPYLSTQKLWISNETILPVKLIIFDGSGTERVIVTYHNFEYNVELDNSIFTV